MNSYEQRRQERIDRLNERADKARAESDRLYNAGREALDAIPFGQPILVGHYSESRDRNYRARAVGKIGKAVALDRQAEELERRADAAASNRAISSDDPNAPEKLREKIAKAERFQEAMTAANRIIRAKPKNEPTPAKIAALVALGMSEETAAKLFTPDCFGYFGFPAYHLQNKSANIRRMRERLAEVEASADAETREKAFDGFTIREDADINRVQILFPGKPDEATRKILKSYGFRWAPSESAWQRQLNANGRYAAKCIISKLQEGYTRPVQPKT